jgi:hypothetical protein
MLQFKILGSHSGVDEDSSLQVRYGMMTSKKLRTQCNIPRDLSLQDTVYLHIPSYMSGYISLLYKKYYTIKCP